ncbi:hypothetical protein [Phenylobacterium sp.]|uniref:hypothetical protein n=1 Tax=Phenylobacterium sp. TaxID=1871053 RepID=UPI00301E0B99
MPDRLYYPHDYTDEVVPCDCTLGGWAEWFSRPDPDWNRHEAAKPGDVFLSSVAEIEELKCVRDHDGWRWDRAAESRLVQARAAFYLRHGQGAGWWADNSGDTVREVLETYATDATPNARAWIAALTGAGEAELRFEIGDDGPRLVVTPVGRA